MSRSVGSGTDKVLRQWEQVKERREMTKEIEQFFSKSLAKKKVAVKRKPKKPRRKSK